MIRGLFFLYRFRGVAWHGILIWAIWVICLTILLGFDNIGLNRDGETAGAPYAGI